MSVLGPGRKLLLLDVPRGLHNVAQRGGRSQHCWSFHAGFVADDDCEIVGEIAGGVEAVNELVIDDEHVDAVFFDAASELLRGGSDVEEEDVRTCITFGCQGGDDAAAVAGHDAQTDLLAAQ